MLKRSLVLVATVLAIATATGCGRSQASKGCGGGSQASHERTPGETFSTAAGVVADRSGRLIVARRSPVVRPHTVFALSRYLPDGRPDPAFGSHGTVVTELPSNWAAGADAVAVQPDGKLLAFGWRAPVAPDPIEGVGVGDLVLGRYLPDGRADQGFGTGGKVVAHLGRDFAAGAVRRDGKIIVFAVEPTANDTLSAELVRYLPNGHLDPSFGKRGKLQIGGGDHDLATARDVGPVLFGRDGTILVARPPTDYGSTSRKTKLVRYQPDGHPDPGFGSGGSVLIGNSAPTGPIAFQSDGKMLATGSIREHFALARYTACGRLDHSFGSGGTELTNFGPPYGDYAAVAAVQTDGKIVAGGSHLPDTGGDPTHEFFVLVRYMPDGRPDPRFGASGKVVNKSLGGPAASLVIQPDGKIIAEGHASPVLSGGATTSRFVLARYTAEGMLDGSFGQGGVVPIDAPQR